MIATLSFMLATMAPAQLEQNANVQIVETKAFAGKLGNRVTRTMLITKDGKVTSVVLAVYHDRFYPHPR